MRADIGVVAAARAIDPLGTLYCMAGFTRYQWTHRVKLLKKKKKKLSRPVFSRKILPQAARHLHGLRFSSLIGDSGLWSEGKPPTKTSV
jgi:hypothetical protein